ncbi:MAG: hypothetical protein ABT01_08125 [Clostridium sp. SCN 57-10]|nr:MAG: hypothetical protein ABT01_08125 [Clostridium sp. SCN 57-10]
MPIRIVDTYDQIRQLFLHTPFDLHRWRTYAACVSPQLPDKCERDARDYDFQNEVMSTIAKSLTQHDQLALAHKSFCSATQALLHHANDWFDDSADITIVLYLGLCNGAGWATTLDSGDAILLGIEKIVELSWCDDVSMRALIFHEMGHLWHKTERGSVICASSQREKSILPLYQEGVAMVFEQTLCHDECYYHQKAQGDWLNWCVANERRIKAEYLKRLNTNQSTQDFFGDWRHFEGYCDVGYYLGCRFIRHLQKTYSMDKIACLPLSLLDQEFTAFAELF